jgi:hypothetical protein
MESNHQPQRLARFSGPVACRHAPPSKRVQSDRHTRVLFFDRRSKKLALAREIESLSSARQADRLTRCVSERWCPRRDLNSH